MKHIATVALMLNLGVAGVYAQQRPVKMTFSGTLGTSTLSLQPNTNTDEQNLAGNGTLGSFTFRELHADPAAPQPSSTCSPGNAPPRLYYPTVAGGGVFRFQDGSLLTVKLTEGSYCIDFSTPPVMGHLIATYQITGGTGRFSAASGALTLTATFFPVLFTSANSVALSTSTGEFEGTVSGVAVGDEGQDARR
jgi:hypothetical protein